MDVIRANDEIFGYELGEAPPGPEPKGHPPTSPPVNGEKVPNPTPKSASRTWPPHLPHPGGFLMHFRVANIAYAGGVRGSSASAVVSGHRTDKIVISSWVWSNVLAAATTATSVAHSQGVYHDGNCRVTLTTSCFPGPRHVHPVQPGEPKNIGAHDFRPRPPHFDLGAVCICQ